jgi:putative FmdB family regulatory protein
MIIKKTLGNTDLRGCFMPIYEFKCLSCNEYVEILIMSSDDKHIEMKCTKCGGEALERIMSSTNFAVGGGAVKTDASAQTRNCSGGSCTTWNLPGHSQ